ncbi:MAG: glycosyltransferase [Acidobacteria bacterium]|nr:glycosyltransferase [Acidobacteriota bacterium]
MAPLKIVIDARRLRDFGIGTYIRSLVHALGNLDSVNEYVLVTLPEESRTLSGLPGNFEMAVYTRTGSSYHDHISFPMFLRTLSPDLFHIPLNRVPLMMPKPYVVTIHDMASLLFEQRPGLRMDWRRFLFRRGLERAERIIAVSASTRRDVQNVLGIPANRVRVVYNAPAPEFFTHQRPADARSAGPESRMLERMSLRTP